MVRVFCVAVFFLISLNAFAQLDFSVFDPMRTWQRIETKYFEIYFSETSERTARKLATIVDEVYEILSERMKVKFSYKFPIVVANQSVLPNGYYSPIPRPSVVIYSSKIGILDQFFFDDDIKGIFVHELTHALSIEEANGFWSVLRAIFGYYIVPNMYLPGVFIESVTVLNESSWGYGRLNDPVFGDKILSEIYYKKFRNFDEANLTTEFPYDSWYLYGGAFFRFLSEKYGYEKTQMFYKENSHYCPLFFSWSFYNNFGNHLNGEWNEFVKVLKAKVIRREYTNNVARVTAEGGNKGDIDVFGDFLIYSQTACEGELSSLKYVNLETGKGGFLVYGRLITKFDVRNDKIAFIEIVQSRYYLSSVLKVGKVVKNGGGIGLVEEKRLEIEGVYDVALLEDGRMLCLVDDDSESKVIEVDRGGRVSNLFLIENGLFKDICADGGYVVLVERVRGKDNIKVLDINYTVLAEIKNFSRVYGVSIDGDNIIFSALCGSKVDVFRYSLRGKSLTRIVSCLFSFTRPVKYGGRVFGFYYSEKGVDIFETQPVPTDCPSVGRGSYVVYNPELSLIVSSNADLQPSKRYDYFNNIDIYGVITSFFPSVYLNPDLSVSRLGVFFNFYDEPLRFRNFYIEFLWNLDAEAVDYVFSFIEGGIPYFRLEVKAFREHMDMDSYLTLRLRERGYDYSVFTFDYLRVKVGGELGDNYVSFYPFLSFSLPAYNGRGDKSVFPGYIFRDTGSGMISPYFTFGVSIDSGRCSLGAITVFEEGTFVNVNVKVSSRYIDSAESMAILDIFVSHSIRAWGNNVINAGVNLKSCIFSDIRGVFSYSGCFFGEVFPVEEGNIYEITLSTYHNSPDRGNNLLSSRVKMCLEFFEVNGGVWPLYITSVWGEFGARFGILFDGIEDISRRGVVGEVVAGVFLGLNVLGVSDNRAGVELRYNLQDSSKSMIVVTLGYEI